MPDRVFIVVITGGPHAGKSTLIREIGKVYGSSATILNEVATILLANVLKVPQSDAESLAFQQAILAVQAYNELVAIPQAMANGSRIIVMDRGILDGAAYFAGGLTELLTILGRTKAQIFSEIDMVIHLETLAICRPDLFSKAGNPHRTESDPTVAIDRDQSLKSVWGDHPNWHMISCQGGIDHVVSQAIKLIDQLVFSEIERKWLIKPVTPPTGFISEEVIEQFYSASGPKGEQRFRKTEKNGQTEYTETFKSGSGLSRSEHEDAHTRDHYEIAQQGAEGNIIHKRRFNYPDGRGAVISLDVFEGALEGHITLEREFASTKEAEQYILPHAWQKLVIKEVTGEKAYSNRSLAKQGLP